MCQNIQLGLRRFVVRRSDLHRDERRGFSSVLKTLGKKLYSLSCTKCCLMTVTEKTQNVVRRVGHKQMVFWANLRVSEWEAGWKVYCCKCVQPHFGDSVPKAAVATAEATTSFWTDSFPFSCFWDVLWMTFVTWEELHKKLLLLQLSVIHKKNNRYA